jgi:hypothetical protein
MKRTNKEVRKAIFEALADGKEHSYGDLERKVNTNWKTIRDQIIWSFSEQLKFQKKIR